MLPFAAGFEAVGEVVAVGEGVQGFKVGSPVATLSYGGFAEYSLVRPLVCFVVSPRYFWGSFSERGRCNCLAGADSRVIYRLSPMLGSHVGAVQRDITSAILIIQFVQKVRGCRGGRLKAVLVRCRYCCFFWAITVAGQEGPRFTPFEQAPVSSSKATTTTPDRICDRFARTSSLNKSSPIRCRSTRRWPLLCRWFRLSWWPC